MCCLWCLRFPIFIVLLISHLKELTAKFLGYQTALNVPWAGKCAGENNGSTIDSIVLAKVARASMERKRCAPDMSGAQSKNWCTNWCTK